MTISSPPKKIRCVLLSTFYNNNIDLKYTIHYQLRIFTFIYLANETVDVVNEIGPVYSVDGISITLQHSY